jgi:hypothetical protein
MAGMETLWSRIRMLFDDNPGTRFSSSIWGRRSWSRVVSRRPKHPSGE